MKEAMGANADCDEEHRVKEFIERNEEQKPVVAFAAGSGYRWGTRHEGAKGA
jgi:succinyl-CoA synthetase alpha subunit